MQTQHIIVSGQVQGVGFRPFVYRLARQFNLSGSVQNRSGEVHIHAHGSHSSLQDFVGALLSQAPPLAKPAIRSISVIDASAYEDFSILPSDVDEDADIHLPPDLFTCDDCLAEMSDARERRYRYAFTNCTQCGPRYTIINRLPYDRPNTSMAGFVLCDACRHEYENPLDRRFHAQPLACECCGPRLQFCADSNRAEGNAAALTACISALRLGQIIGVKGIGGYHLLCDASNSESIARLRQRKHRPDKPLAIMLPMTHDDALASVRRVAELNDMEAQLIASPQRPIVLVERAATCTLPENLAPGLRQLGVFLPYSPLHHLLLQGFAGPLVATSGNLSGEPVITDNQEAEQRLSAVCDGFLQHDRPILRPADDSVRRVVANRPITIRLGRGMAPLQLALPFTLQQPVLAVGGHLKVTVALAWKNRVIISPHISDLDTARGMDVFEQVVNDLQSLYQVKASQLLCDAHPGYQSHRWARRQGLALQTVWHHHAHAASVAGSFPRYKRWLTFCWDGVGLGEDGSLWGGETFYGSSGHWQRVASLRPFFLPGGDKAGREPWRSAAALLWETGKEYQPASDPAGLAWQAWQKKLNCPQSSAAGRLFDAAASLVLGIERVSYEGQGPMQLEAIASDSSDYISLPRQADDSGCDRIDWSVLLGPLTDRQLPAAERAALFHNSLAHSIIEQALAYRQQYDFEAIGLAGGVFQNRRLLQQLLTLAEQNGLTLYLPEQVPVNDAGISYGQVIEWLHADC